MDSLVPSRLLLLKKFSTFKGKSQPQEIKNEKEWLPQRGVAVAKVNRRKY
jgi:hypothetical protein